MKTLSCVLIFASFALITSCSRGEAGDESADARAGASWTPPDVSAVPVQAVTVDEGSLASHVSASGTIAGINEAYVVAETEGIIRSVSFRLGQPVALGDELLKVDDTIAALTLEQARQQWENAQIELESAEQSLQRGGASRAEVLRSRSVASGAKASYERALKAYQDTTITAPIAGLVATRDPAVALGNYLDRGLRVARIADVSSLKLEVAVGEREVSLIRVGAPVAVEISACPDQTHRGVVEAVAAGSDPRTGSFAVVVTWPNTCADRVRSGMSATARIAVEDVERGIIIPSSSIVSEGDGQIVYIVEDDVAVARPVELGASFGNRTRVVAGLSQGEVVVTTGLSVLSDGSPIEATVIGSSAEHSL
jgi:membrane fusion protein (multidrug efflux system)